MKTLHCLLIALLLLLPASLHAQKDPNERSINLEIQRRIKIPQSEKANYETLISKSFADPSVKDAMGKFAEKRKTFNLERRKAPAERSPDFEAAYKQAQDEAISAVRDAMFKIDQPTAASIWGKTPAPQASTPVKTQAKVAPASVTAADTSKMTSEGRALSMEFLRGATLSGTDKENFESLLARACQDPSVQESLLEYRKTRQAHQAERRKFAAERSNEPTKAFRAAQAKAMTLVKEAMFRIDPQAAASIWGKIESAKAKGKNEGENESDSESGNKAAMRPIVDDPSLPRVLLIGDSISIGYTLQVRELLKGKANVHRVPQNAGATEVGLANMKQWLGDKHWDVIHFNFGLHDAKYMAPTVQRASREQYIANLQKLIDMMKATGAKLVFATTTPIPDILKFGNATGTRMFDSIEERNALAIELMKKNGVAINDTYTLIKNAPPGAGRANDVHFEPEGYRILSEAAAKSIEAQLPKKK